MKRLGKPFFASIYETVYLSLRGVSISPER